MTANATPRSLKVAIVGGGPSGLVTLKTLLDLADRYADVNVQVSLFEAEDAIGGTFRYRSYANAQLVSSKQLTAFSDFRLPLDAPDHLSLNAYVQYLEAYVAKFQLQQRAERFLLQTRVVKIVRDEAQRHRVTWQTHDDKTHSDTFTHLALCSGLHVTPSWPEIPGVPPLTTTPMEDVQKKQGSGEDADDLQDTSAPPLSTAQRRIVALHSSNYKSPELYRGKRVLILGTGETGMDMGYEAVKAHAKEIVMCTREGFLSFPAVLENFSVLGVTFDRPTPIDGLITNFVETAYVHPWVARSHFRWFLSDAIIKKVLWVLTGTEAGCNQWVGELPPERLGRAYTFLNKSARAMPYINRSWKKRHWLLESFARYIDPPSVKDDEPGIELAPFPSHVLPSGQVVFRRNKRKESVRAETMNFKPDVIVFATGYTQEFSFIEDPSYPSPADADCRDVFSTRDPSVSFIGFTRPGVGAIPPQAEMSAQMWSLVIAGKLDIPTSPTHYHLLTRPHARIQYGVDYSSYVSQLARDMGSAPSLWELWREYGLFVLFVYCFSAAFPTHYRLIGPWRDDGAAEIVKTEIYETITRRGIGGNLMMGVIPMAFYTVINATAYALECVWLVLQWLFPHSSQRVVRAVQSWAKPKPTKQQASRTKTKVV